MADAGEIKIINLEAIRYVLQREKQVSKNLLARKTGLSFPTVSRLVDQLVEAGELLEDGAGRSTGGRCAQLYRSNPLFRVTLSLRLEGDELRWFISDRSGFPLVSGSEQCERGALYAMDALLARVQSQYSQLGAIAMGFAGTLQHGIVMEAFGYEELRGVNLAAHLYAQTGLPCVVEGDMAIVVTGYSASCVKPPRAAVCIYLGKLGIGAGLAFNGTVWRGAAEFAGELHYLPFANNLDYAKNHFLGADLAAYYGKVIRSYAALLNPDQIVLYENDLIQGKEAAIRQACAVNLPAHAIPQITFSSAFDRDYEQGLFTLANKLLNQPESNRPFERSIP